MKQVLLLFITIFSSFVLFAQTGKNQAIEISNEKTDKYKEVSGMQISIIPPRDFIESDRFTGFEHKIAGSSIMISEVPGDVHHNFLGFSKANMMKAGMIVENELLYQINGFDALFQKGQQGAYGKIYTKYVLVIGDYKKTFLLSASIPIETSQTHKDEVKKSLLSIIYEPDKKVNKEDKYDFSVDVSGTGLIQTNILLSSLIYTDDGNVPSKTESQTAVMVNRTKLTNPDIDKKSYVIKLMELFPVTWAKGEKLEPKPVTIDGLSGYEIYGIGINNENNKAELIYQLVLFKDNYYYSVSGMTFSSKFEEHLETFRTVANSFKLKR